MMKAIIFVGMLSLVASLSLTKVRSPRLTSPDPASLSKVRTQSSAFSTLFNKNGEMGFDHLVNKQLNNTISSLKVVHINGDGGHDLLEVFLQPLTAEQKVMLDAKHPKGDSSLPGGFSYQAHGGVALRNGAPKFLELLLQGLGEEQLQSLKTCGAHMSSDPDARGGNGVWLVLNNEKLSAELLESNEAFKNNKVLLIGSPGKDVIAGKGRSIWVPSASLAFMGTPKHTPMDLIHRKEVAKEENRVLAYQHHNCKATREGFFTEMCTGLQKKGMQCYALGQCGRKNGIAEADDRNNKGGRDIQDRDDASALRYRPYKFVEAFENSAGIPSTIDYSSSGYITEKILPAFLAGAIPIYAGSDDVSKVFNPDAMILADTNHLDGAVEEMADLEKNPTKYKAKVTADAVSKEQMQRFFTWHPATWDAYGDHLRQRIVNQILSFCNEE